VGVSISLSSCPLFPSLALALPPCLPASLPFSPSLPLPVSESVSVSFSLSLCLCPSLPPSSPSPSLHPCLPPLSPPPSPPPLRPFQNSLSLCVSLSLCLSLSFYTHPPTNLSCLQLFHPAHQCLRLAPRLLAPRLPVLHLPAPRLHLPARRCPLQGRRGLGGGTAVKWVDGGWDGGRAAQASTRNEREREREGEKVRERGGGGGGSGGDTPPPRGGGGGGRPPPGGRGRPPGSVTGAQGTMLARRCHDIGVRCKAALKSWMFPSQTFLIWRCHGKKRSNRSCFVGREHPQNISYTALP
jgi:hypothetical protein